MKKWQEMTKEQKQIAVLVALLAFAGLFMLGRFLLMPMFTGKAQGAAELDKLRADLDKARVAMDNDARVRKSLAESMGELQRSLEQYVAPRENPLAWITEKVYRGAREVGIDISSVQEVISPSGQIWNRKGAPVKMFSPYAVKIVTECSYAQLLDMVRILEESNPYLWVSGITIESQQRNIQKHAINLMVEWPMKTGADVPAAGPGMPPMPGGPAGMPPMPAGAPPMPK